jgi:GMP synthase (glutamine-hydrolysing)
MILIISTCQEKLHEYEFVKPIENIIVGDFFVKKYNEVSGKDLKKADKVIISGTSLRDNFVLQKLDNFNWLKTFDKPVFGICAGHHIIQLVFGAKLMKTQEIGVVDVDFEKDFFGLVGKQKVYSLHGRFSLSSEFEIFGKTQECVHAVKHKDKEIYSTLFHPEVYNKEIIEKFCGL